MRIRLALEGTATNDGRLLQPDSLEWGDKQLPVRSGRHIGGRNPRTEYRLVGTVQDVRRERDGWVTGDLWTAGDFDPRGVAAQVDLDLLEEGPSTPELQVFKQARLRGVTLGTSPCWDGMVIV